MDQKFWERCANIGVAIVPVLVHSGYAKDGNTHDETFVGIRYAYLSGSLTAVGPDFWFMLDDQCAGYERLNKTPEEALAQAEDAHQELLASIESRNAARKAMAAAKR